MVLEMRRMNGTIYTDLTEAFPVTSARGNKLLYIAYSYDANGILWEPIIKNKIYSNTLTIVQRQ